MRVFLFGISLRDNNLMNLSTEPIQLVLSLLYISSFDVSFMFGCVCSRYGFQCMLLIRIYQYMCSCPYTPLGIHHTTRWGVWLPWICMFRSWSLDHDGHPVDRVAQRKQMDQRRTSPGPYHYSPPAHLSNFPFVTCERILYYSLYIFLYSHIYTYWWCNILVILCHILW